MAVIIIADLDGVELQFTNGIGSTARIMVRSGGKIQRFNGKIIQAGNTKIQYFNGKVIQAGNTKIQYFNGKVIQVGNAKIQYFNGKVTKVSGNIGNPAVNIIVS